jgi:hypothetical protein
MNEMSDKQYDKWCSAIALKWGNPDDLTDLSDLEEWITRLMRMNEWSPAQWYIKWKD